MPELIYINGDITNPIHNNIVIAHIVNDIGLMGSGVAKALFTKWRGVKFWYEKWFEANHPEHPFKLGEVSFVPVDDERDIVVANMIAQHSIISKGEKIPIRYDAVRKCLTEVYNYCSENEMNLHMPKIGSGLAMGDFKIIEEIIKDFMTVDTYIYEFKP